MSIQTSLARGTVAETVSAITSALSERGIQVFAEIDHAAGARAAGLELSDEILIVFGNPAVGTALMQADPRAGLDLPLRILVWDDGGQTRIAYHDPRGLADAYDLTAGAETLDRLNGLLRAIAALA
jgi:uncharacterized protein (DUF302 family)